MKSRNLLIPVDLMRSPIDALICARGLAEEGPVGVTLLYVLNLNLGRIGRQVYDELCAESEAALRRLAWFFFGQDGAARIVVRVGTPHEEIVAEAKASAADLIILSGPERRGWNRWWKAGTAKKLIDAAPCPALVLPRQPKSSAVQLGFTPWPKVQPAEALLPAA